MLVFSLSNTMSSSSKKSSSKSKSPINKSKLSQDSSDKLSEHESGALFSLSLYARSKRKQSKTLLGSFFDFIEKEKVPVKDSTREEVDEDGARQRTLQRSTQGETTIPIFRNKDIEKKSSSGSVAKERTSNDTKDKNSLNESPSSVEEDSDGYNVAAHLEHLIADLTSQEDSTDEQHSEPTDNQGPQFDESVDQSNDQSNNNRPSEWLARHLFNSRLLGPNEKVFSRTRFKSMLRRIIPDQVPISSSKLPHPPTHRPVKVYNCGTCHFLKLYIVFTLASCIFLCILLDPCFRMKLSTALPNLTTIQAHSPHQGDASQAPLNSHHISYFKNYSSKDISRSRHRKKILHPQERSLDEPKTDAVPKNCFFKKAYILSMFLSLPVYLFIFIVYSCHFVIRYYDFAWFLLEAILLFISSLTLTLLASFAFYLASDHMFVNVIGKFALF